MAYGNRLQTSFYLLLISLLLFSQTPTTLLLKPNGEFYSFGFGARDHYHDLEETEAKKWCYFEKFKMTLHSSQVGSDVKLGGWGLPTEC